MVDIPRLTFATEEKRVIQLKPTEIFTIPKPLGKQTRRIIRKFNKKTCHKFTFTETDYDSCSTTQVRQRLISLMGTDVIRLNDQRYFHKLSLKLQKEYDDLVGKPEDRFSHVVAQIIQSAMDKEEDARMETENERLRRLMMEGFIPDPNDYRAMIHGEHIQHRRTKMRKKMKRPKRRKKRPKYDDGAEASRPVTVQGLEDQGSGEDEEIITQVEFLTRPGSAAVISSAKSKSTSFKKERKTGMDQRNERGKESHLMHVPLQHRPTSSPRRTRPKSAAPWVSHLDQNSSESSSEGDSDAETKSLPELRQEKCKWKYAKTENPLVKFLRKEETVAGLYAIAKELISPIKTADQVYVRPVKRKIMKMKVQLR